MKHNWDYTNFQFIFGEYLKRMIETPAVLLRGLGAKGQNLLPIAIKPV